jgi:hypothetical protein
VKKFVGVAGKIFSKEHFLYTTLIALHTRQDKPCFTAGGRIDMRYDGVFYFALPEPISPLFTVSDIY